MSPSPAAWITLAQLLRPQGRKGEILAELLTDFPERFEEHKRVFLAPQGFSGLESEAREAWVEGFWLPVGKNAGRIVLALRGIDSINLAEALLASKGGVEVIVPEEERIELEEDAEYISDLVGCTVFDHDLALGTVSAIDFPTTPDGARRLEDAAPLLSVLTPDGSEILIPYVNAFLLSVDVEARRILMNLPDGLVDLNR